MGVSGPKGRVFWSIFGPLNQEACLTFQRVCMSIDWGTWWNSRYGHWMDPQGHLASLNICAYGEPLDRNCIGTCYNKNYE